MELIFYQQIAPCDDTCGTQSVMSQCIPQQFFCAVVLREEVNSCIDLVTKCVYVVDVPSKIVEDVINHLGKGFLQFVLRTIG